MPRANACFAYEVLNPTAAKHADAMALVQTRDPSTDFAPESCGERSLQSFDHGDFEPELAHRSSDFRSDETGAYDGDTRTRTEGPANRMRIIELPQREDPVEVGLIRKRPSHAAGGDHETVERNGLTAIELNLTGIGVEPHRSRSEPHLGAELLVALSAKCDPFLVPLASEKLFRERRAVIGKPRFLAEQHDVACEPRPTQELDRTNPSERGADDDDLLERAHR